MRQVEDMRSASSIIMALHKMTAEQRVATFLRIGEHFCAKCGCGVHDCCCVSRRSAKNESRMKGAGPVGPAHPKPKGAGLYLGSAKVSGDLWETDVWSCKSSPKTSIIVRASADSEGHVWGLEQLVASKDVLRWAERALAIFNDFTACIIGWRVKTRAPYGKAIYMADPYGEHVSTDRKAASLWADRSAALKAKREWDATGRLAIVLRKRS